MDISAKFDYSRLDHAKDHTPNLVVSLKAPQIDWVEQRPTIAILPVVDLSGSMEGDKLTYAKQSCLKLIEHLQTGDFAGLVTFSNSAEVVVKPQRVDSDVKLKLKKAVEGLRIGGGTNFAAGLVDSIDEIQKLDLPPTVLHRVIMFTDGMPTVGICDNKAILALLEKKRARATVSAFGYGAGAGEWTGCDQDFLTELSSRGRGNYAYVRDPDDALGAFGKELGGLLSTYATDLHIEVEPANGAIIKRVITNVPHEEDPTGMIDIPLSDIMGEETRHFVIETEVKERAKAFPRDTTLFEVRVRYDIITEEGAKETRTAETKAQVRFVRAKEAQEKPDKDLDEIIALHQTIRAQLDAEEQAKQGNYEQAAQVMAAMADSAKNRGHENIAAAAQNTSGIVGSSIYYAQSQGYLRSFANGGTRAYGTSALDDQAAVFLSECNVSLNNSAMDQVATSFTTTTTPPNTPASSGNLVIPSGSTGK